VEIPWNLLLIALGSILCAVAINGILVPRQFLAGGFTGLSRFKNLVHQKDPDALVVITETLEVMGKGIGNQPHW
jgi:uncharacterized membrane-anchored protein YitT (DUF2179 family)